MRNRESRSAEAKVPGGKLVRLTAGHDGDRYIVEISGDFFAYPEEGIALLESALSQMSGREPEEDVRRILAQVVAITGIELVGVDVDTIAKLFKRCTACGE